MPNPGLRFSCQKSSDPPINCWTMSRHAVWGDEVCRVAHVQPVRSCAGGGRTTFRCRCRTESATIVIEGESAERWQQGAVEAWVIQRGTIRQDIFRGSANELVAWIDRAPADSQEESRVTIYLEGAAQVDFQRSGDAHAETGSAAQSIRDHSWFGKLTTRGSIDVRARCGRMCRA